MSAHSVVTQSPFRGARNDPGPPLDARAAVLLLRTPICDDGLMTWERELLQDRLDGRRQHILEQLDGLSDDDLRRPVLPSGWSCLGLVRHLTLSDERYWFETVVAGGDLDYWPAGPNADWSVGAADTADGVLAAYRAAIAASNEIIAARSLDDVPAQPEDWWADAGMRFPDLRSVIMHVIVETATHAGQLDAVRELIDGKQHIVL